MGFLVLVGNLELLNYTKYHDLPDILFVSELFLKEIPSRVPLRRCYLAPHWRGTRRCSELVELSSR